MSEDKIKNELKKLTDRSQKQAWKYKEKKMNDLIDKIQVVENKILKIIEEEKMPLMNEIDTLRKEMVDTCIHPSDMLVIEDEKDFYVIKCKFCNTVFTKKK